MTTQRSDARKRAEALFADPRWCPDEPRPQRTVLVREALAEVYTGASFMDAECLLDQLEDRGVTVEAPVSWCEKPVRGLVCVLREGHEGRCQPTQFPVGPR